MNEETDIMIIAQPEHDADRSGHLATALFVTVIALLLVLIYALSTAA